MPEPEPVTMATFPARRPDMNCVLRWLFVGADFFAGAFFAAFAGVFFGEDFFAAGFVFLISGLR